MVENATMNWGRKGTRRQFLAGAAKVAIGVSLASLAASCGGPLSVRMGIVSGSQTLWRYVAHKKDELLKPKGYQVEFQIFPDETALRAAYVDNRIDVIATMLPAIAALAEAGAPVQFFLPIAWLRQGYLFIVPKASPVTGMAHLIGRRVAVYSLDNSSTAYWRAFLPKNYGLRIEQLTLVESSAPAILLEQGQVEAAMVGSNEWSVLRPTEKYRKVSDLYDEWQKASGSSYLLMYAGYGARPDFVQKNSRFIEDFIRINYEALQEYKANKSVVLDVVTAELMGPPFTEEQNEFIAWYLGYDDVPAERIYISQQDLQDYEKVWVWLADAGYLRAVPSSPHLLFYISPNRPQG